MENEFIAHYKTSYQISPDDWDVSNRTLKIREETTIKEILDWYRLDKKKSPLEVSIIQIQTK